jgi:hypothetical protein
MPPFGPLKRKDLIKALKQAGFEDPYAGGKDEFLVKGGIAVGIAKSTPWRSQPGIIRAHPAPGEHLLQCLGKKYNLQANRQNNSLRQP